MSPFFMIEIEKEDIGRVAEVLKRGSIIIFPTETSYGLGCDPANQAVVDKIFKIKNRAPENPLLVVVPNIAMARKYLVWNDVLEKMANQFWPGALTIVANYKAQETSEDNLAQGVVARNNTLALRVTAEPWLQKLLINFGRPLVATSANISESGEIFEAEKIRQIFSASDVAIFVDAGDLPQTKSTTIIDVTSGELIVLRQGEVNIYVPRRMG